MMAATPTGTKVLVEASWVASVKRHDRPARQSQASPWCPGRKWDDSKRC